MVQRNDIRRRRNSNKSFFRRNLRANNLELSMYDFVQGCAMIPPSILDDNMLKNWQDGLSWFRTQNAKAYMVLLD